MGTGIGHLRGFTRRFFFLIPHGVLSCYPPSKSANIEYYGHDPQKARDVFNRFLRSVAILPMTKPIMLRFAQIRGELRRKGQIIGDFDMLIAATALHHNLTLVTRNLRDYQRIPNLSIYKAG
jgi:predicted nucleic acid-binding protein